MVRDIQNHSRMIRIPCHVFQRNYQMIVSIKKLEHELERTATKEEIAEYTGSTLEQVYTFQNDMIEVTSLNKETKTKFPTEIITLVADENIKDVATKITNDELVKTIKNILSEIEFNIVSQKVGLNCNKRSVTEMAASLNLTNEKFNAIYRSSVKKLKKDKQIMEYMCS